MPEKSEYQKFELTDKLKDIITCCNELKSPEPTLPEPTLPDPIHLELIPLTPTEPVQPIIKSIPVEIKPLKVIIIEPVEIRIGVSV
ncbi:MAG: hypothetical protein OIN86_12995 [Candidatus Methanoperedens sp.]|nr:hypothetical protein [Candidatus Methanoperedens sp.]CAG0948742.1 hypothetical protein METP1_00053 [Methanosarcinales archaeon]